MTLPKCLFILGSSGFAKEIVAYAADVFPERKCVLVNDFSDDIGVISVSEYWNKVANLEGLSILGSGRCEIRLKMMHEIKPPIAILVHHKSVVFGSVNPGCVVAPGAVIAPNAILSDHVVVNYNATIGHDCVIGELSIVGPGASIGGWCKVGKGVYIGAGALIREKLRIGDNAVVGMGAVITKDVPANMVAIGIPARFYSRGECGKGWML
jgi:sugar O-acyltransferase (sialic acid O-acetyltransferase NeuD family)